MASPQLENGYTKIANEILEALAKIRISGEAGQVFYFIIRKTYGYNKREDPISLSQFVLGTGLAKPTVCKAIRKLKELNIITQKANAIATIYSVNKDFSSWQPLPKKPTLPKKPMTITQLGNKRYPIGHIQKKKETITKDTVLRTGETPKTDNRNPLIQELWEHGQQLGFSNTKQNLNRYVIKRLLRNKSPEQLKKAADFSQQIREEMFSPQVNNWMDLEEKYLKLRDFVKRHNVKAQESQNKHVIL